MSIEIFGVGSPDLYVQNYLLLSKIQDFPSFSRISSMRSRDAITVGGVTRRWSIATACWLLTLKLDGGGGVGHLYICFTFVEKNCATSFCTVAV